MDIPAKESATSRQDIIIAAVCVCLMDQKHRAYL